MFTGLIFNLFASEKAIGATIRTVATFSTRAEIKPVRRQINSIAQAVFFALSTMTSAICAGIRLSIKMSATISVPMNIPITFQLMAKKACLGEIALRSKRAAEPQTAIKVLFVEKNTNKMYAKTKTAREIILGCIL
jgi:hypothetical protein